MGDCDVRGQQMRPRHPVCASGYGKTSIDVVEAREYSDASKPNQKG